MAKWIPFPAYQEAPIDISFLFESEKPAGKHGFLKVDGDVFRFEDGTEARFWGTNLNGSCCFPEKADAEKLAKRLAAYGCNMARIHQIDAEWAAPNVHMLTKGRRMADTRHYDEASFARLDYLIYCLQQEGIYIYMDNMTFRKFREEDGVRNAGELGNRASPYCFFDRRLIELQKEYMKQIWDHYNPYLGLKNKDNPQIVMTDIANEICLFGSFSMKILVEPYASEFREMYRDWCKENNVETDVDATDLNDLADMKLNAFKEKVSNDYYTEMMDYLKELGVKIPMTGPNFCWNYQIAKSAQHIGDYADSHLNVRWMPWSPKGRYWRDWSFHEQQEWSASRNVARRHFGKPFFSSEWDLTFPNKYRAESTILMAAMGRLQNWSGFTIHTYAYTAQHNHRQQLLGKEVSAGTIDGVGYREGPFATWCDPCKFGLFYHGSLITRRGDVKPAEKKITVAIDDVEPGVSLVTPKVAKLVKPALRGAAELCQIGVDYWNETENAHHEQIPLVEETAGEVRSDTGEMYRSWEKKYGIVDTPMTKSVYGRLAARGKISLTDMEVECENEYAVITVSSLNNDLGISQSDNMLLSAVGDAKNTDMKVEQAPVCKQNGKPQPPMMELIDFGKPPILAEVVEATIRLKTDRKNLVVWSVDAGGVYAGKLPVKYEDGYAVFTIGKECESIYYLIQAE